MNKEQRQDLEKIRSVTHLIEYTPIFRETIERYIDGYARVYVNAIDRKLPPSKLVFEQIRGDSIYGNEYLQVQFHYCISLEGRVKIWGIEIPGIFIKPSLRLNANVSNGNVAVFEVHSSVIQKHAVTPRHPHNLSTESDGTPICLGPSLSSLLCRNPESLIAVAIAAACNVSRHGYGRMDRIARAAGVRTPPHVRRYLSYE